MSFRRSLRPFPLLLSLVLSTGRAGVLRDLLAAQDVIEVMLHVQKVVLDDETQSNGRCSADDAGRGQPVLGNAFHQFHEQGVVMPPSVEQRRPRQLVVPMSRDPGVLIVAGAGIFAVERGARETNMIVDRRVDQMSHFFLAGPAGALGALGRLLGGERREVREFKGDGAFERG